MEPRVQRAQWAPTRWAAATPRHRCIRVSAFRVRPVPRRRRAVVVGCTDPLIGTGEARWWEDEEVEEEEEEEEEEEDDGVDYDAEDEELTFPTQAWRQQAYPSGEDLEDEYVDLPPEYQGLSPEQDPLERRVSREFLDAIMSDEVSDEDAKYWFTKPEGGWDDQPKRLKKAESVPTQWPMTAEHFGDNRTPLSDFKAGQVLEGEIEAVLLYHGAKVDLGGEYDGLIPVTQLEWMDVREDLCVGEKVKVRVWKVYDADLYRWPIQLEVLEPNVQHKLTPAASWNPPVDHRGHDMDEIMRRTGRVYVPPKYFPPVDPAQMADELIVGMDEDRDWDYREDDGYQERLMEDIVEVDAESAFETFGIPGRM